MVIFSNGVLDADKLNNAFIPMHKNNRFAKLSIYVDTYYSGSMFRNLLPDNINVYAISSSKPKELSWFWNYDDKLHTYISKKNNI